MSNLRYRFKTFIRKHHKYLTYSGALIVFLTFVIKEGLGDSWRSTANTIATSQYMYTIYENGYNEKKQLTQLHLEIRKLQRLTLVQRTRGDKIISYKRVVPDIMDAETAAEDAQALLAVESVLADRLPIEDNNRTKVKALIELSRTIRSEAEALDADVGQRTTDYKSRQEYEKFLRKSDASASNLLEQAWNTFDEADVLKTVLFEDAENIRKRNEKYSEYAWWITVALFTFGWGLGLLGKIYDMQGVDGV